MLKKDEYLPEGILPKSDILVPGKEEMDSQSNGSCTKNREKEEETETCLNSAEENIKQDLVGVLVMAKSQELLKPVKPSQTKVYCEEEEEDDDGEELADFADNRCKFIHQHKKALKLFCEKHTTKLSKFFKVLTVLLLLAYFCYAMYYSFGDEGSITLIALYLIVFIYFAQKHISRIVGKKGVILPTSCRDSKKCCFIRWFLYITMTGFAVTYIIMEVGMKNPRNLWSLAGMLGFVIPCLFLSTSIKSINWHCIFWCISVQFLLAVTLLRTEWGVYIMEWVAGCVKAFMANGYKSSEFLFGNSSEHRIVMKSLPLLFLVNAFLAILYHFGLMQIILKFIGKLLSSMLDTTPPESLSVAANLFLGGTQASLVIKPYLNTMSVSELFALLVGCFASVSGVVFGIYINFGAPAKHLLTASIMSAPASFAVAKLLVPETKPNRNHNWENAKLDITKYKNVIDATGRGALEVVGVFASIVVNLYVFYALLEFLNSLIMWSGARIGIENLSFQFIVSYLLMPLPVFMGVDLEDCRSIAKLIGYKLVGSNSLSFIMLGRLRENRESFLDYTQIANRTWHYKGDDIILDSWNTTLADGIISERSTAIATYAMCGFSNFSSIGIMLGTLYALIPKRVEVLVNIIFKAMIAGNISCYLTACIAGVFYE